MASGIERHSETVAEMEDAKTNALTVPADVADEVERFVVDALRPPMP